MVRCIRINLGMDIFIIYLFSVSVCSYFIIELVLKAQIRHSDIDITRQLHCCRIRHTGRSHCTRRGRSTDAIKAGKAWWCGWSVGGEVRGDRWIYLPPLQWDANAWDRGRVWCATVSNPGEPAEEANRPGDELEVLSCSDMIV